MDTTGVIEELKRVGGLTGVCQVTTFTGFRRNKQGEEHEVVVELRDYGAGAPPHSRYQVFAYPLDGEGNPILTARGTRKTATGNADPTIEQAITFTHWQNLD